MKPKQMLVRLSKQPDKSKWLYPQSFTVKGLFFNNRYNFAFPAAMASNSSSPQLAGSDISFFFLPQLSIISSVPRTTLPYLMFQSRPKFSVNKNLLLLCHSHTYNFINSYFYGQSVLLWNAYCAEIRISTNCLTFKE